MWTSMNVSPVPVNKEHVSTALEASSVTVMLDIMVSII